MDMFGELQSPLDLPSHIKSPASNHTWSRYDVILHVLLCCDGNGSREQIPGIPLSTQIIWGHRKFNWA